MRGHVDLFGIGGEVHQCPLLEPEQRRGRVAVFPVLLDRVGPGLAGLRVLQFDRGQRQAVERQHHIDRRAVAGVARHLTCDGQLVLAVGFQHVFGQIVRRLELGRTERLAVKLEAMTRDVECALEPQLFDDRLDQHRLQVLAVQIVHVLPQLRLGRLEKREQTGREQRVVVVPLGLVARSPAGLLAENLRDAGFEGGFGGLFVHWVGLLTARYFCLGSFGRSG